jgi:hypothetical protein
MPMSNRNKYLMQWANRHAVKEGWVSPFVVAQEYMLYLSDNKLTPKEAERRAYQVMYKWGWSFGLRRMNGSAGAGVLGLWQLKWRCPECNSPATDETSRARGRIYRKCDTCQHEFDYTM